MIERFKTKDITNLFFSCHCERSAAERGNLGRVQQPLSDSVIHTLYRCTNRLLAHCQEIASSLSLLAMTNLSRESVSASNLQFLIFNLQCPKGNHG